MRIHDIVSGLQTPSEAFVNAVNMQAAYSGCMPRVLSYAPIASMNPFQRLLYSRASDAGYAIVPTLKFHDLGCVNWSGKSVIHLHWLASILKGTENSCEATLRLEAFRQKLIGWKIAGHKLLWTMHNVLPHDATYPEQETELRKIVVSHADAIHILSANSLQEADRLFHIPTDKVFHVPHPSYEGWYANVSASISARLDLNIRPNEVVFLQFGSIQPYKGTLALIDAFQKLERLCPHRRMRLIIAGKPVDKSYLFEIHSRVASSITITVIPNPMEEREVQTLFNSCDVVVAPYKTTLNSGVALLAATFKKAIVAPKISGILETYIDDHTLLYSNAEGDTLLDAMARAIDYRIEPSIFLKILANHLPEKISILFFDAVTEILFNQKCEN